MEHHAGVQTIDENTRHVPKFLVDRVQLLLGAEPGAHPAKALKPVGEVVATAGKLARSIGETKARFRRGGGSKFDVSRSMYSLVGHRDRQENGVMSLPNNFEKVMF